MKNLFFLSVIMFAFFIVEVNAQEIKLIGSPISDPDYICRRGMPVPDPANPGNTIYVLSYFFSGLSTGGIDVYWAVTPSDAAKSIHAPQPDEGGAGIYASIEWDYEKLAFYGSANVTATAPSEHVSDMIVVKPLLESDIANTIVGPDVVTEPGASYSIDVLNPLISPYVNYRWSTSGYGGSGLSFTPDFDYWDNGQRNITFTVSDFCGTVFKTVTKTVTVDFPPEEPEECTEETVLIDQIDLSLANEKTSPYNKVLTGSKKVGNFLYTYGSFYETITVGGQSITSNGNLDFYIAKADKTTGELIWLKQIGGTNQDMIHDLEVRDGLVYFSGRLGSNAFIDGVSYETGGFLAILDDVTYTDGRVGLRNYYSCGAANIQLLEFTENHTNLIVTGYSASEFMFMGRGLFPPETGGHINVFTYTLSVLSGGNLSMGGPMNNLITGPANFPKALVIKNSNIYVTGSYSYGLKSGGTNLADNKGIYIQKFNFSSSTDAWTKVIECESCVNYEMYNDLAVDHNDNVYLVAHIGNGGLTVDGSTFPNSISDAFLLKFNNQGNLDWLQFLMSDDGGLKRHNLSLAGHDIYLATSFRNEMTFDGYTFTSQGEEDVLLARFDENGGLQNYFQIGNENRDYVVSLNVVDRNIFLTGKFSGALDIPDLSLNSDSDFSYYNASFCDRSILPSPDDGSEAGDSEINWILSRTYDQNGEIIAGSKVFFDDRGKQRQSQSKMINGSEGFDIFISQPIYDRFDRPVISTLSSPLNASNFIYTPDFVLNAGGEVYSSEDISDDYAGSIPTGAAPVSNEKGLGLYYSDHNPYESYTPVSAYPYSLTQYYDDGSGEVKRIAAPGEQFRMGSGHEVYSKTFPLLQELDVNLGSGSAKNYSYLSIRNNHVFPGEETPPVSLAFKGIKTVSIDQNGAETITITDENGNVLATATSNPHYNMEGVIDNEISVYLTATIDNSDLAWLDFHVPNNGDIGKTSGTIDVNFSGGVGNYTLYNLKADNHKQPISTSSIGSQSLNPSFYRLMGDGHTISYSAKYYNWTYNYYDLRGRLVVSISPNGVKALQEGTAYVDIDKTTYQYNHQGWLLSMTEPDAGTTRYIYRKDGSIRFSQNAKQELSGAFSYTKYDAIGRPVESGEYNGGTTFEDPLLLGYLEDKGYDAFPNVNTSQELITFYSFPDNAEFNPDITDEFGYCPKAQNYVRGAVSFTRNDHMKTWYSYDEFGQVEWMIQKPAGLDDYFHIEYEYDYFGNVTQVKHYRKSGTEELDAFYHRYIYDRQQRLKEVYAGSDGAVNDQNLQAKYYYYHHGPLKRVELGPDVPNAPVARQGIDYVYTLQGWLKSINHPEAGKDPGKDGVPDLGHADFAEDLFAMTIEYFNGDYVRSGSGIGSVQTSKEYFNGNISSIGWRTGNTSSGATPVMYAYNYDNSYQLTGATFGTPDYTTGTFTDLGNQYKVKNLAYDPNGNIQSLVRYSGKPDDDGDYKIRDNLFNYQYFTNKNKLDFIEGYADYDYNAIGQLTEEILEKAGYNGSDITRNISYDVTGKVTNVNFVGTDEQGTYNKNAEYIYDDRGFRLKKKYPDGKETWYIRDAGGNVLTTYERMSETDELEIKETMIYGSGRIGMYKHDFVKLDPDKGYISGDEYRNEYEEKDYELLPGASLTLTEGFVFDAGGSGSFEVSTVVASEILGGAQYELADHLGNVRVAIANERTSLTFSTNLETAEGGGFENVTETRHQDAALNHTPGGSYSSWLNNAVNGQTLGPSISLAVSPGDTVRMSAYGMYRGETAGNTGVVNTLVAALAGSFTGTSGLEAGEILNKFAQLPAALTGAGMEGAGTAPKAYLKYIVFDKNFKPFDAGNITTADTDSRLLTEAAYNAWEKLEMEVPITKNGYIYIYTANESVADVNVHFDDVAVTLIEGPVTSASDYYPFGLVMDGRSWTSEPYRFGYQGQFAEYDEETGWNSFELRMYDPVVGRWFSMDPYRQFPSSYVGMGNNPILLKDSDGGQASPDDWRYNKGDGTFTLIRRTEDPYHRIFNEKDELIWASSNYKGQVGSFENIFAFRSFMKEFEAVSQAFAAERNRDAVNDMLQRAEQLGFNKNQEIEIKILYGKQANLENTIGGLFGFFKPNWFNGKIKFSPSGSERLYNGVTSGRSLKEDAKTFLNNSMNDAKKSYNEIIYEIKKGHRDFHNWFKN